MSEPRVHDAFQRGHAAYRREAYFEAHEHWEEAWHLETDAERRLLWQALVQLAAGLHKLRTGVRVGGAPTLLGRAADKLPRVSGSVFGIDPRSLEPKVRELRDEAARAVAAGEDGPFPLTPPALERTPTP